MNFYNEIDPAAAAWLRGLIASGDIPPGVVDERSITDIQPDELLAYTQCHFFAGIGGWSLAFELARWHPTRPVWSGSCPCPPFSSAGKKKACPICEGKPLPHPRKNGVFACIPCGHEWYADDRHLWPAFFRHIAHCRPPVVFGEQVAGADGLLWLAGVRATMEGIAYGFGAADLCAAGVRSPHIRQRLYWVAERVGDAELARRKEAGMRSEIDPGRQLEPGCSPRGLADSASSAGPEHEREPREGLRGAADTDHGAECRGDHGGMAHGDSDGRDQGRGGKPPAGDDGVIGDGHWADAYWLECRDGKHRRVPTESALFPLADGLPYKLARRGSIRPALLKGAGNAIVPQVAAEFIAAYLETLA